MAASQCGRLCAGPPWRSAEGRVSGAQHHRPLQQQLRSGTQDCQTTLALVPSPTHHTIGPQLVDRSGVALQQHVCNAVCPEIAGCHAQFCTEVRGASHVHYKQHSASGPVRELTGVQEAASLTSVLSGDSEPATPLYSTGACAYNGHLSGSHPHCC